jgi:hypothetical protein
VDIPAAFARTLALDSGRARLAVLVTRSDPAGTDEPEHVEDYSLDIAFERSDGIVSISAESLLHENSLEMIMCPPAGLLYSRQSWRLRPSEETPDEPGRTVGSPRWTVLPLASELTSARIADLASAGPIAGYLDPVTFTRFAYEASNGYQSIHLSHMPSPFLSPDPGALARILADPRIRKVETARGIELTGPAAGFLGRDEQPGDDPDARLSINLDADGRFIESVTLVRHIPTITPDVSTLREECPAQDVSLHLRLYALGHPIGLRLPAAEACRPRLEPSRGVILDILPPSVTRRVIVDFEGAEARLGLHWFSTDWLSNLAAPMVPVSVDQELIIAGHLELRDNDGIAHLVGVDHVALADGRLIWEAMRRSDGTPLPPEPDAAPWQQVALPILRIERELADIAVFCRVVTDGWDKPLLELVRSAEIEANGLAAGQHVTVHWISYEGEGVVASEAAGVAWIVRDDGVSISGGPHDPYASTFAPLARDLGLLDFLPEAR